MHVELFAVDLRERGRSLREELALLKSEIHDKLAANKVDAENLEDAIQDAKSEDEAAAVHEQTALTILRSISAKRRIAEAVEELETFRRDKRQFLIDQLNQLFHGLRPRAAAS